MSTSLPLSDASERLRASPPSPSFPGRRGRPRKASTDGGATAGGRGPAGGTRGASEGRPRVGQVSIATLSPRLLPAREAAKYLGVSYDKLLDLRSAGTVRPLSIPGLRKLVFDVRELDDLVERWRA